MSIGKVAVLLLLASTLAAPAIVARAVAEPRTTLTTTMGKEPTTDDSNVSAGQKRDLLGWTIRSRPRESFLLSVNAETIRKVGDSRR